MSGEQKSTGVEAVTITATGGLSQLLQNPTIFFIMLLMLGGQGMDLFASTTNTAEFRALRQDVERALEQITDNTTRIARSDERIDDLSDEVRVLQRELTEARHERARMSNRLAACEEQFSAQ